MTKLGRLEKKHMISDKHAKRGIEHVERLLPYVNPKEGQSYLEIGCGNGHVCKHLAGKYRLNVTGTDVDPEMIQFANEDVVDVPNVRFMEMDAAKMPFQDDDFDIILSFGVLHHISNWQDVLGEISRVLRPEGHFIFGDIAYSRFTTKMMKRMVRNYGFYTIGDIVQFMKQNDFEVVHEEPRKGVLMKYYSKVFLKK